MTYFGMKNITFQDTHSAMKAR